MRGSRRNQQDDDDDTTNPFADDDSPKPKAASRKKSSSSSSNPFAATAPSTARDTAAANPFAAPSSSSSSSARGDYNPFASPSTPPEKEKPSHVKAPSKSSSSSSSSSASSASAAASDPSDGASAMASYYAQLAAAPPAATPPPAAASVTRKSSVSSSTAPSLSSASSASQSQSSAVASASSAPVFKLEALDGWKPSKEQGRIVHMAAGNDVLCVATSTNWLIRWSVEREEVEPILLSKRVDDAVHKVFVDPFGHHCLVAMVHGSTYYLHSSWSKAHTLSKLKGVVIDSVAWHAADGEAATSASSGRILLGTSTGLIYETVLDSVDKDKSVKKLYDLNAGDAGDGGVGPVCGLSMELFPSSSDSAEDRWVIIAATPRRQYEFVGGPTASAVFERYASGVAAGFLELPGTLSYTELRLNAKYGKEGAGGNDSEPAKAAAWLTGAGIYYSQVRLGAGQGEHVLEDGKLLSYPVDEHGVSAPPLSCALTDFHLVLLNNNRLCAINQLSEETVWQQAYKNHTDLLGFAVDACKSVIWMYMSRGVYELVIEREDSGMCALFLQQGRFDEALQYADTDDERQAVRLAQADELFANKLYQQAAKLYAETSKQFEDIALKFVHISGDGLPGQKPHADELANGGAGMNGAAGGGRAARLLTSSLDARAALKIYLLEKLGKLPAAHRTQQTMICTWLTEIFLDNINRLHDAPSTPALTTADEQRRQALNGKQAANGGDGSASEQSTVGSFNPFRSIDDDDDAHSNGLLAAQLGGGGASSTAASGDDDPYGTLSSDERNDLCEAEVEQFRTFLADWSNCLDPATTIALLSSHGRMAEWLQYASNDLEWVLQQHVQEAQWRDALQLLRHRADATNQADLFYKFVPAIITHLPAETVDMLCEKSKLDPAKLIPALMRYEEQLPPPDSSAPSPRVNQALRYLEHAVYRFRSRDTVVHNYCIAEGTLVALADGRSVPIEEVVIGSDVLGYVAAGPEEGSTEGLTVRQVNDKLDQGIKQCVELLFSDGRRLVCTPDHRIRTADGRWVEAGELVVDSDEVAVGVDYPNGSIKGEAAGGWRLATRKHLGYDLDMADRAQEALAFARLLGYALTDGSTTDTACAVSLGHQLDADAMLRDVFLLTGQRPTVQRGKTLTIWLPVALSKVILQVGVQPGKRTARSSHFPAFISASDCPAPIVREFLGGLFGGDGRTLVLKYRRNRGVVHGLGYCTTRKGNVGAQQQDELLQAVQRRRQLGQLLVRQPTQDEYTILPSSSSSSSSSEDEQSELEEESEREQEARRRPSVLSDNPIDHSSDSFDEATDDEENDCEEGEGEGEEGGEDDDDRIIPLVDKDTYGVHIGATMLPLFRVRLVGRRDVGEKHVYDLSVPSPQGDDGRSFLAAGIVVHNCVSLYAVEADTKPFLRYLDSCRTGGPVFDTQYALRVCYEHNQPEACVAIYALMGLYEEAGTLALQADIPLAKRVIQQAESATGSQAPDPHTIKRLWLLIAKTIIASHSSDLHTAMSLLKDCGSLQLEDMLPYFPDFVRIGELKDEINRSLTSYNAQIDALQADMSASTQQAADIREQLLQLKQRSIHINTSRKCDRCALPALSQPFLLFPCTHTLHAECAKAEWRAYWDKHPQSRKHALADRSARERERARERQQQRTRLQAAAGGQAVSQPPPAANGGTEWSALSKAQKEDAVLAELIASECCLCGSLMIDSVQLPFVAEQDPAEQKEIETWRI